jgi:hypothetical protein
MGTRLCGQNVDSLPATVKRVAGPTAAPVEAYQQANDEVGFYPSGLEYGAELGLSLDPTAPNVLRSVSFPYYANYERIGGLTVRLYLSDGGAGAPGTLLGSATVSTKVGKSVVEVTYPFASQNRLPVTLIVTTEFRGLGGANTAGWYLSSQLPTVGSQPPYFWSRTPAGSWRRLTFGPMPDPVPSLRPLGFDPTGAFRLQLSGQPDRTYSLQATSWTGSSPLPWLEIGSGVASNPEGVVELLDPNAWHHGHRIYRAVSRP